MNKTMNQMQQAYNFSILRGKKCRIIILVIDQNTELKGVMTNV